MMTRCRTLVLILLLWSRWLLAEDAASVVRYSSNQDLAQQLKALVEANRKTARLQSLGESRDKSEIWMMELGGGEAEKRGQRPAFLVVAGIEGQDLAGTASVVVWMEQILRRYENDQQIRGLLDSTTLYVFPRLNPDAAASWFAKPKVERAVNGQPVDDDHDGLVDEDGPEDLDGDGLITGMRINDPAGEYILDPVEPRLLVKADKTKGEAGAWRYYSEGLDNDHDELWNEDGPGGVNLNRNFPYGFKFFAPGAGIHPVSEVETRALADFIVAHPNIGIVFTFGVADNLVQTPKAEPGGKKPPAAIQEEDLAFYRELGKSYREAIGIKKELQGSSEPGTFSDWMYFHRGRLSLAARAWSPAYQLELAKGKAPEEGDKGKAEVKKEGPEVKKEEKPKEGEKAPEVPPKKAPAPAKEPDNRNEEDRAFLKWIDQNSPGSFVPWKRFAHPDFPGKEVEIGGFAPFAKAIPPEKLLSELADKQAKFLTELATKLPRISIRKTEVKPLGESIYDLAIQVQNTGYLPTSLAQGELTREVNPTRLVLKLDDKRILSGSRITLLGPIPGSGGMKEVRYIVNGKGHDMLEVEVISMLAGSGQLTVELKEAK